MSGEKSGTKPKLLRKDLLPGDLFKYVSTQSSYFWVPIPGRRRPFGFFTSDDPALEDEVIRIGLDYKPLSQSPENQEDWGEFGY